MSTDTPDPDPIAERDRIDIVQDLDEIRRQRQAALNQMREQMPPRDEVCKALARAHAADFDIIRIAELTGINRQQLYRDADFRAALGIDQPASEQ